MFSLNSSPSASEPFEEFSGILTFATWMLETWLATIMRVQLASNVIEIYTASLMGA